MQANGLHVSSRVLDVILSLTLGALGAYTHHLTIRGEVEVEVERQALYQRGRSVIGHKSLSSFDR